MAIAGNAFDPKEFQFLVAEQAAWGTLNAEGGNPYIALDVDSIGSPTLGVTQVLDVRSGSRVLQATDFFQDVKGSIKEISVSGTVTTAGLDLLLSNLTGTASVPYAMASNISTSTLTSSSSSLTNQQLLSIVYSVPSNGKDMAFKDCFCTNLTLNGDANTEGSRIKFSATFKTGSLVADLTNTSLTVDTAISQNNYFMNSWSDGTYRSIAGVADAILSSFSLELINDVEFVGLTSTGFEQATRAGEASATASFTVLYDTNFIGLFETFNNQTTGASQGLTTMNPDGSIGDGDFGFKMTNSIITDISYNEANLMMLDVSVKALGSGEGSSTALISVGC
tara:strand:- start:7919 stop:8929 length:1011 start_codon:yes stop_codon:yes gene_type:complete